MEDSSMNDRQSKSQFSKFNVTNHLSYRLKKKRAYLQSHRFSEPLYIIQYVFKIHRRLPERATSKKSKKPATRSRGALCSRGAFVVYIGCPPMRRR